MRFPEFSLARRFPASKLKSTCCRFLLCVLMGAVCPLIAKTHLYMWSAKYEWMNERHAPLESYRDELCDFCDLMCSQFSWENGYMITNYFLLQFFFVLILFHPTLLLPFSLQNVLFHKVSSSMIFLPRESPSVWEALSETLFSSPHYYTKDDYLTRAGDKNQSV